MSTHERELRAPVDLTDAYGHLCTEAIGFSRTPRHRAVLRGRWGRKKRWDYWCVQTPGAFLQVTVAHLDYLGLADVSIVDLASGEVATAALARPLGVGVRLPEGVEGGRIEVRGRGLELRLTSDGAGTRIEARGRTGRGAPVEADVVVLRPPGEESLNVVVPWDAAHFQLTSKHVARPARGRFAAGGREHVVLPDAGGFGCLDYGRGVWPLETTWNWGTGAARVPGLGRVGLQLGGRWTDGTGSTENGVFLDGRLDKLGATLAWRYDAADFMRPWRVKDAAGDVALTFTPALLRRSRIELGLARSALHLAFGRWSGRVRAHGRTIELDGLLGWAEEHAARW